MKHSRISPSPSLVGIVWFDYAGRQVAGNKKVDLIGARLPQIDNCEPELSCRALTGVFRIDRRKGGKRQLVTNDFRRSGLGWETYKMSVDKKYEGVTRPQRNGPCLGSAIPETER